MSSYSVSLDSPRLSGLNAVKTRTSILTEVDQQSAVSLTLIRRQRQNAGHVVVEKRILFLKHNERKSYVSVLTGNLFGIHMYVSEIIDKLFVISTFVIRITLFGNWIRLFYR